MVALGKRQERWACDTLAPSTTWRGRQSYAAAERIAVREKIGRGVIRTLFSRMISDTALTPASPEPEFEVESCSTKGDLHPLREAYAGFHQHGRAVTTACPVGTSGHWSSMTRWRGGAREGGAARRRLLSDDAVYAAG
jgi:hypothetical protein